MRKFVVLLLTIMLFAVPVLASDTIDLKSMSDKDLLKLQENVQTEIKDRGIDRGSEILMGKYVVGTDIKPGKYIITANKKDMVRIDVYGTVDKNTKEFEMLNAGKSMYVGLTGEETLEISDASAYIKETNPDWAPTESTEQPAK